jgi:hypothetical protein
MRVVTSLIVGVATFAVLNACTKQPAAAAHAPTQPAAPVINSTDRLVGQWNGPEGTYLLVAGVSGKYAITIRNLDGPRTFQGHGTDGVIHFSRDGTDETMRAADGAATGMKWLSEKKQCVVVRAGEGYCRD